MFEEETKALSQEEIKKLCEENQNIKKWYLSQCGAKSVEHAFKIQKYQHLVYLKYLKNKEKINNFVNKEIEYLSTLLKKLKKIFNKAKKDQDIKQLKYLDQKIKNLNKDKNYIRFNYNFGLVNNGVLSNKISKDFDKIQINVRKEIKLQGEK